MSDPVDVAVPPSRPSARKGVVGYAFALGAGVTWGTTGPLSTALYAEGAELTGIGFWRILLGTVGLLAYGAFHRELFRVDRRGLLLMGLVGGALVALFEVAYQFAIAGVGVAGAAALLYTAPVMVAFLGRIALRESLTPLRLLLAMGVMAGAALTVRGGSGAAEGLALPGLGAGVVGGLLTAGAYAGTTVLARYVVPRYGSVRMLFFEAAGGTLILAALLPLSGHAPAPPPTAEGWAYIGALAVLTVLAANFLFFAALRRIEAAPTAVAATIEPVAAALLALLLFAQRLTAWGWLGLGLVVGSVAAGYRWEGARES
ncbi:MAG: DMT family transporter [Gemmatimonadota bacterium]